MMSLSISGRKLLRKKLLKMPSLMASDGISREQFKRGSLDFMHLSGRIGLTNLLDITSQTVSDRLQNAIKYCTEVRQTSPAGKDSNNSAIV